jgi:hypothetical protein
MIAAYMNEDKVVVINILWVKLVLSYIGAYRN